MLFSYTTYAIEPLHMHTVRDELLEVYTSCGQDNGESTK